VPALSDYAKRKKALCFLEDIPPQSSVLDIGCGSGWVGEYLRPRGCDYVGMDVVPPADILGDITRWRETSLAGGSFDVIVAFEVLEHVDCIKACYDLLVPGGEMYVTTPVPGADPFLKVLERLHLNQRRSTPHSNLLRLEDVPYFEDKKVWRVAGLSQWGIFRKAEASQQPIADEAAQG
jgi:2-polyprenyl-3-methyl-5-hydroxy-6-metoxy-1,4-benzoquinol methylase